MQALKQNIYISSDIASDMSLQIGLITSTGNDWTFQKRWINKKIQPMRSASLANEGLN
jgi:hypothetical protein